MSCNTFRQRAFFAAMTSAVLLVSPLIARAQNRGNFTAIVVAGYGVQIDAIDGESGEGVSGLAFGIGGFVSPDLALMLRFAGTTVEYELMSDDFGLPHLVKPMMVSGMFGVDGQYWLNDRWNMELGVGRGFVGEADSDDDEAGLGLLGAVGYALFLKGKFSAQLGVEYTPVFLGERMVHNVGVNLGLQLL
jgi:hypothetical protein